MTNRTNRSRATLELTETQLRQVERSLASSGRFLERKIEEQGDSWRIPLKINETVWKKVDNALTEIEMRSGEVVDLADVTAGKKVAILTGALLSRSPVSVALHDGPAVLGRVRSIRSPPSGAAVVDVGGTEVSLSEVKGVGYVLDERTVEVLAERGQL